MTKPTETERLLVEANDLLRSLAAVVSRRGAETNWSPLQSRLNDVLREQHQVVEALKETYGLHQDVPDLDA